MERLVKLALRIITALIIVATVVSFSESYHGLFEWAITHSVPWFWSLIWPLMLDTVILVGECAVFVAIHRKWHTRHRVWAWAVTYTGLGVSTLANGGHVASKDWLTHVTNALPPVALMFALTVGLGVLKRTRTETVSQPAVSSVSPVVSRVSPAVSAAPETPRLSETVAETPRPEAVSETAETETVIMNETETPAETAIETPDPRISETLLNMGYKATDKSFTMPRDPREGLSLPERRVRDMYDVDPDITGGKIEQALGISRATAYRYLGNTRKARGLE